MVCTGAREKGPPEHTQKWEFITLSDFKATSAWTSIAYIWLWLMGLVSVAVYAVDTFTAINLLVFDKWSSQIQPAIAFKYSKWIFAVCICLSWALCLWEWIRAVRVIKRGGVAQSYMDPLAVTLQSMRSKGWRRFLVFTELTKSKKGADYVAFFVYFAFNGAVRIILAEAPRQFVNGMTLYAVMNADLIVHGTPTNHHSSIEQFWLNLQQFTSSDTKQAVILFSMLFTLVIWVFSALSLIIATVLYLTFLWHYIPQRDGRLSIYCRRKVDRRLEKIVEYKVKAAIEEDERKKQKAEQRADLKRNKTGEMAPPGPPRLARQPTLPQLGASPEAAQDAKMKEFGLVRQNTDKTVDTLPRYESRPSTRNGEHELRRHPTLPDMGLDRPGMPSRNATQASQWSTTSYESNAPLLSNAGYAGGEGGRNSPAPAMPTPAVNRQDSNGTMNRPMPPNRSLTQGSQRSNTPLSRMDTQGSQRPYPPMSRMESQTTLRPFSPMSRTDTQTSQRPYAQTDRSVSPFDRAHPGPRGPPVRSNTGFSFENGPRSASPHERAVNPYSRTNTTDTFATAPMQPGRQASPFEQQPQMARRPTYGSLHNHKNSFSRPLQTSQQRRYSPPEFATPFSQQQHQREESYEMTTQRSFTSPAPTTSSNTYTPFNPSVLTPALPQLQPGPRRNITVASGHPGTEGNYFGHVGSQLAPPRRSATAPVEGGQRLTTGYADILDDYGESESPEEVGDVRRPSAVQTRSWDTERRVSPAERRPSPAERSHTAGPQYGTEMW